MNILPKDGPHIDLSAKECDQIYQDLLTEHANYLASYNIKFPQKGTARMLQLIFLRKYMGTLVHKDTVSAFISRITGKLASDQQIRHLAADGWYVLNKSDKIPSEDKRVPNGYHVLVTTEFPKPNFLHKALKRAGRMSAQNFDQLKITYNKRCATCGSMEDKPHFLYPDKTTEIQKGHMDPSKPLTLGNTIPQCQVCNQSYQDDYVFDEKGRVISLASSKPIMNSSREVKQEVFDALKKLGFN